MEETYPLDLHTCWQWHIWAWGGGDEGEGQHEGASC